MAYSTSSYNFFAAIFFIFCFGYLIQACKRRRQRDMARRMNMNPGLAAIAREQRLMRQSAPLDGGLPPPVTYTVETAVPVADAVHITTPHGTQAEIPTAYAINTL